jgi:hypothetical protein
LESIRVEPNDAQDQRLCFRRDGSVLIIAGSDGELARIVGTAVLDVAEGPETKNWIRSHVHLDPTSDPDNRWYGPGRRQSPSDSRHQARERCAARAFANDP